jgi:hydroxymethylpyrimidine pyrophosphatase-like HAD family hydrolase
MKILIADLDSTLLGADAADRRRLHAALVRHPEVTVVFATGCGLPSVREALRGPLLPRWIIADAGASVIDGVDLAPIEVLRADWPGAQRVRATLRRFPALTHRRAWRDHG